MTEGVLHIGSELSRGDFSEMGVIADGLNGTVAVVTPKKETLGMGHNMLTLKKVRKNPKKRRMLFQERNALQIVTGAPFVQKIICCFQSPTAAYFVTEFHRGGTLNDFMRRTNNHTITGRRFNILAAELIQGLSFIHNRGVVHCDIKPENVVIDRNGHVVIIDFGHSFIPADGKGPQVGTRAYKAPEMFYSDKYDEMVDWWSLGVTLLYIRTLHNPFRDIAPNKPNYITKETLQMYRMVQLTDLYPKSVSVATKDFIWKLLRVDPKKRLGANGSAHELRAHAMFKTDLPEMQDWSLLTYQKLKPPFPPTKVGMWRKPRDGKKLTSDPPLEPPHVCVCPAADTDHDCPTGQTQRADSMEFIFGFDILHSSYNSGRHKAEEEESMLDNQDPDQTADSIPEDQDPDTTADSMLDNQDPDQTADSYPGDQDPDTTAESMLDNQDPDQTADSDPGDQNPDRAPDRIRENRNSGQKKNSARFHP